MSSRAALWVALLVGLATISVARAGTDEATAELITAISANDGASFNAALDAGAFVNADVGESGTPLITAVLHSRAEMVRALLDRGANPNGRADDPAIGNAVTAAASAMNGAADRDAALEVLKLVVQAPGADLNVLVRRAGVLKSALMMATEAGASDAVEVLLDAGADVNTTNGRGDTALDVAVNFAPEGTEAPTSGRVAIVRMLLEKGARPGQRKS